MTWRILKGKRLNNTFGFDVSRPGIDVTTANPIQLAFSSDYICPVVVAKGAFTLDPIAGPAPSGKGVFAGAVESVGTIPFGRDIYPVPAIFAIATAPSWNVPLVEAPTFQLGYLAGLWHTYVSETMPNTGLANDNTYGPLIGKTGGSLQNNFVDATWCSARFSVRGYSDRAEFHVNCTSTITIKYLILEG